MADSKKERERQILDEVYADRTFYEIEHLTNKSPDFLIRPHPRTERFGVEITEFYLTEGEARLQLIEGYRTDLLDGGDVRHKDDYHHFEVAKVDIVTKEGEIHASNAPMITRSVPHRYELARMIAAVIADKEKVHDAAPKDLSHINLIIRDRHGVLRHRPSKEFCMLLYPPYLREAVFGSRFREVYFISRFKEGDSYVPLKMVLTLMKMHAVYDCVVASKGADPFADANAFMRWFAFYLSTITAGGVRISEETGDVEVLYGNIGIILAESGTKIRHYADRAFPASTMVTVGADWDDLGAHSRMPAYQEAHVWDSDLFYPVKRAKRSTRTRRR
jgi:hypothetical protein